MKKPRACDLHILRAFVVSERGVEPIAHHFTLTTKFLLGQG